MPLGTLRAASMSTARCQNPLVRRTPKPLWSSAATASRSAGVVLRARTPDGRPGTGELTIHATLPRARVRGAYGKGWDRGEVADDVDTVNSVLRDRKDRGGTPQDACALEQRNRAHELRTGFAVLCRAGG